MAAGAGAAAGGRSFSFKVVLLGEGCVGKTSLVLRYCENKFNDKHITTLQVRAGRGGRWCGVPLLSPLLRNPGTAVLGPGDSRTHRSWWLSLPSSLEASVLPLFTPQI